MKVLSVASTIPYPPDHGTRLRTWHLLTRLSSKAEITLITWSPPGTDPAHEQMLRSRFERVNIVPATSSSGLLNKIGRRIRSFTAGVPPWILEIKATQPVPEIRDQFDLAIAEDDISSLLLPDLDCPVVVHRHNLFTDTIEGLRSSGALGTLKKIRWTMELPMWRRIDRRMSQHAAISIVTTPEAAVNLMQRFPGSRVEVVGNGVDVPERQLTPSDKPVAAFIGTMDYEPNVDAVLSLCDGPWQTIRSRIPDAQLWVIGRSPDPALRRISAEGVRVVGEVPDMVEACDGVRIGLIPLHAGSGIKNKTLELMAMGLPVVATPQGCEGIQAGEEHGLIRVHSQDELVAQTCRMLGPDAHVTRMGQAARDHVAASFSWDAWAERYLQVLETVVSVP